jgi:hypothetical protein
LTLKVFAKDKRDEATIVKDVLRPGGRGQRRLVTGCSSKTCVMMIEHYVTLIDTAHDAILNRLEATGQ